MSLQVFRSARTISALTLGSRALGLLRDMACGYAFGVTGVYSSFTIAFQVPNLFRRLFGEGALSAASIPVLTETLRDRGSEGVSALVGRLMGLLFVTLVVLCVVAELVVAGLYYVYRDRADIELTLVLSAITLPYMILVCSVAMLSGVQNVFGRFAAPALMPVLLNIFMIAGALTARGLVPENLRHGVIILACAVVLAGVVQFGWQWFSARRCGITIRPRLDTRDPDIRRIAVTMLPMMAGLGAVQLNTLLDALIAWWFVKEQVAPGSEPERVGPAILYFAQRLYQFPLGVFAIALATAIFPALARHAADEDLPGLAHTLSRGIRVATFEGVPCLIGLILVREPLVAALFKRGEFAEWTEAVDRVGLTLAMYALGIWAYAVNHLVVRAFYALKDAKTPLKVAVATVGINLALNLILVQTALKEAGLALATSIGATVQITMMVLILRRRLGHLETGAIVASTARTFIASALMAAGVVLAGRLVGSDAAPLLRLSVMVPTGAIIFVVAAIVLRCDELRDILRR